MYVCMYVCSAHPSKLGRKDKCSFPGFKNAAKTSIEWSVYIYIVRWVKLGKRCVQTQNKKIYIFFVKLCTIFAALCFMSEPLY